MINASDALDWLKAGNQRFVSDMVGASRKTSQRVMELTQGQAPFAIVLGCSDSRVPLEIIFDQGLGDLFVIRVAGNIVAPSLIGSVEFAASKFGTRLVVVLGHSDCGAVGATIDALSGNSGAETKNLDAIVQRVRPSVEPLMSTDLRNDRSALTAAAVRANISASAAQLRTGSPLLEQLIADDGLRVVGAEYALDTGIVEYFDGLDDL